MGDKYTGKIDNLKPSTFKPDRVVHAVLKIDKAAGQIVLGVDQDEREFSKLGVEGIEGYVAGLASGDIHPPGSKGVASQYDIKIGHQCWVLVQLSPDITNCYFATGRRGASVKESSNADDNLQLHHVDKDFAIGPATSWPKSGDDCRILYFGAHRRGGKKDEETRHSLVNFNIEIRDSSGRKTITIFDPDVPNDGDPFP